LQHKENTITHSRWHIISCLFSKSLTFVEQLTMIFHEPQPKADGMGRTWPSRWDFNMITTVSGSGSVGAHGRVPPASTTCFSIEIGMDSTCLTWRVFCLLLNGHIG
jgi:hypothetical protein